MESWKHTVVKGMPPGALAYAAFGIGVAAGALINHRDKSGR